MDLDTFNALDHDTAVAALLDCCASRRWAEAVTSLRPYRDVASLGERSDEVWAGLDEDDWLEAFASHPRIGDKVSDASTHGEWSRREQASMIGASTDVRSRLAAANQEYEKRFGRVFLVCATGLEPDEMLARCEARLDNDPASELAIAAEEQRKITRLRLARLID